MVLRQHSGHSGAMPAANADETHSKLKLVLDATTAGGEHAVILDVLQMRTRTRNTCNVKIGTFPVHLGLDHACYELLKW